MVKKTPKKSAPKPAKKTAGKAIQKPLVYSTSENLQALYRLYVDSISFCLDALKKSTPAPEHDLSEYDLSGEDSNLIETPSDRHPETFELTQEQLFTLGVPDADALVEWLWNWRWKMCQQNKNIEKEEQKKIAASSNKKGSGVFPGRKHSDYFIHSPLAVPEELQADLDADDFPWPTWVRSAAPHYIYFENEKVRVTFAETPTKPPYGAEQVYFFGKADLIKIVMLAIKELAGSTPTFQNIHCDNDVYVTAQEHDWNYEQIKRDAQVWEKNNRSAIIEAVQKGKKSLPLREAVAEPPVKNPDERTGQVPKGSETEKIPRTPRGPDREKFFNWIVEKISEKSRLQSGQNAMEKYLIVEVREKDRPKIRRALKDYAHFFYAKVKEGKTDFGEIMRAYKNRGN